MEFNLIDSNNSTSATITRYGQQVVSPISYDDINLVEVAVINTAYNVILPKNGSSIIITGVLITTLKDVGVNGTKIELYVSGSAISSVSLKGIITVDMLKQSSRDILPLNLRIRPGYWVNTKADDNTVILSVLYYYQAEPDDGDRKSVV